MNGSEKHPQSLALAGDFDPQQHGIGGGSQVDFEVKNVSLRSLRGLFGMYFSARTHRRP